MNSLIAVTSGRMGRVARRLAAGTAIVLIASTAIAPMAIRAEVQIRGKADAVRVEAQNTTIEEILVALGSSFDVQYQSSTKLEKQITGTYQGSLQRVLARVLDGYNFVLKTGNGKVEITVLGPRNNVPATAVASSAPPASKTAPIPSASPAPTKIGEPPTPAIPAAPIPSTTTKVVEAVAKGAEGQATKISDGPVPYPEMKLAEAPIPVPTIGSGPIPEATPSTATLPIPQPPAPGSAPLSGPIPQPSTSLPPMPMSTSNSEGMMPMVPIPPGEGMMPMVPIPPSNEMRVPTNNTPIPPPAR